MTRKNNDVVFDTILNAENKTENNTDLKTLENQQISNNNEPQKLQWFTIRNGKNQTLHLIPNTIYKELQKKEKEWKKTGSSKHLKPDCLTEDNFYVVYDGESWFAVNQQDFSKKTPVVKEDSPLFFRYIETKQGEEYKTGKAKSFQELFNKISDERSSWENDLQKKMSSLAIKATKAGFSNSIFSYTNLSLETTTLSKLCPTQSSINACIDNQIKPVEDRNGETTVGNKVENQHQSFQQDLPIDNKIEKNIKNNAIDEFLANNPEEYKKHCTLPMLYRLGKSDLDAWNEKSNILGRIFKFCTLPICAWGMIYAEQVERNMRNSISLLATNTKKMNDQIKSSNFKNIGDSLKTSDTGNTHDPKATMVELPPEEPKKVQSKKGFFAARGLLAWTYYLLPSKQIKTPKDKPLNIQNERDQQSRDDIIIALK